MRTNPISRRSFIQKTVLTAGAASVVPAGLAGTAFISVQKAARSNREVWIAGISQMDLTAESPEQLADKVYKILDDVITYKPDFVVLPEYFPWVQGTLKIEEKVAISDKVQEKLSGFAKQHNCYMLCPAYTNKNGKNYNSVVVFDRTGKKIGGYNKIHCTEGEIHSRSLSCGQLSQPVIETEYGPIGIQICYDINWDDGWKMLRDQGAKIIFWCSAFDGGLMTKTKAWQHKCIVATSTLKNVSRLVDISGETIAETGIWNPNYYCAPVNMEKVFFTTYKYLKEFAEIERKYGRKVKITTYHAEEWTIIESLSPDVYVDNILKEFNMRSHEDDHKLAAIVQNNNRA